LTLCDKVSSRLI